MSRDCTQASVVLARKLLRVSDGFNRPPATREAERRKARLQFVAAARLLRKRRRAEAAERLSTLHRGVLCPRDRASGHRRERIALAIPRDFPAFTSAASSQPVAAAHSSGGRRPEASRGCEATSAPRPQAPHPAPRQSASRQRPSVGRDGMDDMSGRERSQGIYS